MDEKYCLTKKICRAELGKSALSFVKNFGWLTPWRGIVPTAWSYFALIVSLFDMRTDNKVTDIPPPPTNGDNSDNGYCFISALARVSAYRSG